MKNSALSKKFASFAWALFIAWGVTIASGQTATSQILILGAVILLALACSVSERFRGLSFSAWVAVVLVATMFYPLMFRKWGPIELKVLIVPLIQLIMFGMGTMLSLADFARVLKMPRAIAIGMFLQFSIMPLLGAGFAMVFDFPPEVAAGVVLVGSCPGGVASNVMTFLARGNVALSVTMTACSTLASPLVTPLAVKFLAGQYVQIEFVTMMIGILKMIVAPILIGLVANRILQHLNLVGEWLERTLSIVAMSAICFVIGIIVSLSRDQLLSVGAALFVVAITHNALGYLLGYGGAWLLGLEETDRRTVAIEVGLQNGGMATGLATNVLQSTDAALAPAIFGPWMNISGSMLASWWRDRSPDASRIDNGEASTT